MSETIDTVFAGTDVWSSAVIIGLSDGDGGRA